MTRQTRKRVIMAVTAVVVVSLVVLAFLPTPIPVETATVRQGPLQVTVEEEGVTAVENRYAVLAPVSAQMRRIQLEPGDFVRRGAVVAELEPPAMPLGDPTSRAEAAAQVSAAEATARSTERERERMERLVAAGGASQQQLDLATAAATRAAAELAAARAALRRVEGVSALAVERTVTAPVSGRVLSVHKKSEGRVNPGDTLIVIGDPAALEVRVDVLSEDAVLIHPGTRVMIDAWSASGEEELRASVKRVDPQGFTEVSSLGVEEQRVNVVVGVDGADPRWQNVGVGYRVIAQFVVWESPDVIQVPSSAVFRVGAGWAVFAVEDGRAVRRELTVGQQAGLTTQILAGLQPGEQVIVHPGNDIEDGVRVGSA
jgi:HlyD family secretion protein